MPERIPFKDIEPSIDIKTPIDKKFPRVLIVEDNNEHSLFRMVERLREVGCRVKGIFVNPGATFESDQEYINQRQAAYNHVVDSANESDVLVTDYGPGQLNMRVIFARLRGGVGVVVMSNQDIEEDEFEGFNNILVIRTIRAADNDCELLINTIRICKPMKED